MEQVCHYCTIYAFEEIIKNISKRENDYYLTFWASSIYAMNDPSEFVYGYNLLTKDILPSILLSLVMYGFVWWIGCLKFNIISKFLLQVVVGIVIYIGGSIGFRIDSFEYLLSMLRKMIRRKAV